MSRGKKQQGSGRPATKFMERPKKGPPQDPSQSSDNPSPEEIGEEAESGNMGEDPDEGRPGQDPGGPQQQQKRKKKGLQGPDDN